MSTSSVPEVTERLLVAMVAAGLNRAELAERANVPYRTLQNWLRGEHGMPAAAVAQLASAVGVSCDWLLTGLPAWLDPTALRTALAMTWATHGPTGAGDKPKEVVDDLARTFYAQYTYEYLRRFEEPGRGLSDDLRARLLDHLRAFFDGMTALANGDGESPN